MTCERCKAEMEKDEERSVVAQEMMQVPAVIVVCMSCFMDKNLGRWLLEDGKIVEKT